MIYVLDGELTAPQNNAENSKAKVKEGSFPPSLRQRQLKSFSHCTYLANRRAKQDYLYFLPLITCQSFLRGTRQFGTGGLTASHFPSSFPALFLLFPPLPMLR